MVLPKLPRSLEVGRGTALFLEGRLRSEHSAIAVEVDFQGRRTPALGFDLPQPGRLAGSDWWQAIVPVMPVEVAEEHVVTLRARYKGRLTSETPLGLIRLEPGAFTDAAPVTAGASASSGLVAVCLATYDPPLDLLERQLESIRDQTHDDWICVVCDDGSPEAKWSAIESLVGDDARFVLERSPERRGFYRNFERALRLVPLDAAYVALADQDDFWHPDKLAVLVDALAGDAVLAHSDALVVEPGGRILARSLWAGERPRDELGSMLFASAVTGASCLFRRRLLDWALPFPPLAGQPFHDRWLALVASALGEIVRVDRPLYDYVQHPGAALGHSGVAGRGSRTSASALVRKVQRFGRGELRPDWRAHHDGTLMRTAMEAEVLRLRAGHLLSPRERRKLAMAASLPGSLRSQAGVALGYARKAQARRPGLEAALVRGLAWRRIAKLRTTATALSERAGRTGVRTREHAERVALDAVRAIAAKGVPIPPAARGLAHVPATIEAEDELRRLLAGEGGRDLAGSGPGPGVSVVLLGLGEAPPALDASAHPAAEIVRPADGLADALERCEGELILFLDVRAEPVGPDWLAAMVKALEEHDAACVGARLIHPRRPRARRVRNPDLTLAQRGLHFPPGPHGMPVVAPLGAGESPRSAGAAATTEVPAVSAACMLVRKAALSGLDLPDSPEAVDALGAEISVRLRERGGRVLYAGDVVAFDPGGGDQPAGALHDRLGPLLFRRAFADGLKAEGEWTQSRLRVGITVTRASERFGYGDHQVATQLGNELERFGWDVVPVELHRRRWRKVVSDLDVLVVLLDRFPLDEVPRGVVTVAWVRNWTERWLERPWFGDFDLVFASSAVSKQLIDDHGSLPAEVMPLAVDPDRFKATPPDPDHATDVLFAGNRWGLQREVEDALGALPADLSLKVLGRGWEESPRAGLRGAGRLGYERMPAAYSGAKMVIDDSAAHAKPYGAVNARVFEALACGSLVISNDADGVRELFDAEFPTWSDGFTLRDQIETARAAPERSRELIERYRGIVLERHTYRHRAEQLRDALLRWCEAPRIGIAVGVPDRGEAVTWGDYHFARSLARSFERRGRPTRIHLLAEWHAPHAAREDVSLHLLGLSEKRARAGQLNALWNISHPELITRELIDAYDIAFIASESFAAEIADAGAGGIEVLRQATDPTRFRPAPGPERFELLFVGNARGRDRPAVRAAARSGHRLSIFGQGWTQDRIDLVHVEATEVRNEDLHRLYNSAAVVLSDHWPEMRERGFISNRIYDALASGACVVSDRVEGISEEFEGAVATFDDERELHAILNRLLADPAERAERAERGRRAVLARHTFDLRAQRLLEAFDEQLGKRGA